MNDNPKMKMIDISHDYGNLKHKEFESTKRGKFVFHENYYKDLQNSTVTISNEVRTWAGQHKVVLREGKSKFGNEIIFQSCIRQMAKDDKGKESYKASTEKNYPTTEIYFPATMETIDFLKKAIFRITREMERINGS
jgi:hypothetical protein